MNSTRKFFEDNNFVLLVVVVALVVYLHSTYERRAFKDYVNAKLAGR